MPIQEIEARILREAEAEAARLKKENEHALRGLDEAHARKKRAVREEILRQGKLKAEEVKRSHLIPARLLAKRRLLEEKQTILHELYREIGRQKKMSAAEISSVREKSEVKAAKILFGEMHG